MPHIHEKIDFTVSVYVVHKDKVLIRKHEKYHRWLAVGGHIELDEDANTAAIREVKEEVGLDITLISPPHTSTLTTFEHSDGYKELVPPMLMNIHDIDAVHKHHDLTYAATSGSDVVIPENEDDEWLWLTETELLAHPEVSDRIKSYGAMAFRIVGQHHS